MNLLLVTTDLHLGGKSVAAGDHRADEGVGGHEIRLHGGGDLGVLFLDVRLKEFWVIKGPGHSLLPAGDAEVVLLVVLNPLDTLVDFHLVLLEIPSLGEADGTHLAHVHLLVEMDCGLVPGQMWSVAKTQAAGGTLNNISIITLFTPNLGLP